MTETQPPGDAPPLLTVEGLEVVYHTRERPLVALSNVSFEVLPGEILGVVGESGCGKSTLAAALMRLLPPNGETTAGTIRLGEQELLTLGDEALRKIRGRDIGMIFQDPLTSLNPTFSVGTQLVDAQKAHRGQRGEATQTCDGARSGSSRRWASPTPPSASTTTRTSSRAGCGSGS